MADGVSAVSGVADQPMSEAETRLGAINRVQHCLSMIKQDSIKPADYVVAFEGGVDAFTDGPATFAYVAISNGSQRVVGRSGNLLIPPSVYTALQCGQELGHVIDAMYGTHNIKQKGGAIGLLTKGLATRQSVYVTAMLMAMSAFEAQNPESILTLLT